MKSWHSTAFRFQDSLTALAQFALRETSATGYALFQNPGTSALVALGEEISEADAFGGVNPLLLTYAMQTGGVADGLVAFSYGDAQTQAKAGETLHRVVPAMETVWQARNADAHYLGLARRLSALESQLIDSRIVERAKGLISAAGPPEGNSEAVNSLVSHVRNVFRPGSAASTLELKLRELENEIQERRVTSQAKALLQAAHSLSEDQAYAHLRTLSRKSRRRLGEVAADVMTQYSLKAKTA